MLRAGQVFTKNSHLQLKKEELCFSHSKRENPLWQEAWRIPRGKIFWGFKNIPGMSCHSSFFHFDLHDSVVRCGFRYLCFSIPKQNSSTSEGWERCDREDHRSTQVTIERISTHKYLRCQNSNNIIFSLIS